MSMKTIVSMNGVTKNFGDVTAVSDVSLEVDGGEIFGYIGPNGAGKTTTIRIILGLLKPTAGKVFVFGKDPYTKGVSSTGAVLDNPGLFLYYSAYRNLAYYAEIYDIGDKERRIDEVLRAVGLENRKKERVEKFSHGMKQRLALARALLPDPDLLVLDEPTTGLDPDGQEWLREKLSQLASEGKTIFYSSHQLSDVEEICTRVAIIKEGKIVLNERMEEIKKRGHTLREVYRSTMGGEK